jgi:hypothetical protein
MAEPTRWVNQSQPQTLYMAQVLLYINAVITALFGGLASIIGLLFIAAAAGAAFGIANERKWGYYLGVCFAGLRVGFLAFALLLEPGLIFDVYFLINSVFPIALFALLLHPQSREYQRIWFK